MSTYPFCSLLDCSLLWTTWSCTFWNGLACLLSVCLRLFDLGNWILWTTQIACVLAPNLACTWSFPCVEVTMSQIRSDQLVLKFALNSAAIYLPYLCLTQFRSFWQVDSRFACSRPRSSLLRSILLQFIFSNRCDASYGNFTRFLRLLYHIEDILKDVFFFMAWRARGAVLVHASSLAYERPRPVLRTPLFLPTMPLFSWGWLCRATAW